MPAQRFSYFRTFLLGFGFFGVSVIWGIYNSFVPVFLQGKFHLPAGWIGFFMTLDNIAQLIIQPPVGVWSDKLRTPIGRRMPFILVGAPLAALAFGFIPLVNVLPLFVCCTSTLLISMAVWRTPAIALMPDLTPSASRSQANSIINLMGGVGGIICYFGGALLNKKNPAYPFWMGSVLVLGATLLLFLFIREPKVAITDDVEEAQGPGMVESLRTVLTDRDKSALFLLLSLFCWTVGFSAIEGFWTLYATNHVKISASSATILLGGLSLVFVLVALPCGYLGAAVGRRVSISVGLIGMAVLLGTIYLLPVSTLTRPVFTLPVFGPIPVLGVLLMVAGVAWACITIHALPMVVDMTDDSRIGTYTSLYYLFSTLGAIAGPNVNGFAVQFSGNNYNTVLLSAPIWMIVAFILLLNVKSGEAKKGEQTPAVESNPAIVPPIAETP